MDKSDFPVDTALVIGPFGVTLQPALHMLPCLVLGASRRYFSWLGCKEAQFG